MYNIGVAPFAGAWIEIDLLGIPIDVVKSLPSRERGLKCKRDVLLLIGKRVAPFAGAWIEIDLLGIPIEVVKSLPSRERGLTL